MYVLIVVGLLVMVVVSYLGIEYLLTKWFDRMGSRSQKGEDDQEGQ
jgi:hypothetical protein